METQHELAVMEQVALLAAVRAVVPEAEPEVRDQLGHWLSQSMRGQQLGHTLLLKLAALAATRDATQTENPGWMGRQAARLAQALGLDVAEKEHLGLASVLHDVGKLALPAATLLKPSALDGGERRLLERHAAIGAALLDLPGSPLLQAAAHIALSHHERWDGRGYPQGLSGDQIPLNARILHVLDVYGALVSQRAHREAWRASDALDYVRGQAGWQFDPEVVQAFVGLHVTASDALG